MANCSEIFAKSEPPTNPMATFFRSSDRSSSIAGDTPYVPKIKDASLINGRTVTKLKCISTWRAGVRVPSTSNKTNLLTGLSEKVLGAIPSETMETEARR